MSFLDRLCCEDDETVENFMYQEYWYLANMSGLFLNLKTPKWRIFSGAQVLIMLLLIIYDSILLCVTAAKSDDLFDVFQDLHLTTILMIGLVILLPLNKNRPNLAIIHRSIANGLSNYDKETEKFRKTLKVPISERKKYLIAIIVISFSTQIFLLLVIGPTLDRYSNENNNEIYSPTGVSLNLPIPLWSPFGTETWTTFLIQLLNEVGVSSLVCAVVSGADLMAFVIAEYISLELDLLSYALNKLPERTLLLYKKRFGNENINIDKIKEDKYLSTCYKECLKQSVTHHQKIIDLFNRFNAVDDIVLFLIHSIGGMVVAFSGILIVFAQGKTGSRITSMTFCIFEVLNLFFGDWFAEQMVQASDRVAEALYSTKWMNADRDSARIINIMLIRSQKPLMMNFAKIMDFRYETFTVLMNSAYSYFNLLFAFAEKFT